MVLSMLHKGYKLYTNPIHILSVALLAILYGRIWPLRINQMESLDFPSPTPSWLSHCIGPGAFNLGGPWANAFEINHSGSYCMRADFCPPPNWLISLILCFL